jgi:hypothetical protein
MRTWWAIRILIEKGNRITTIQDHERAGLNKWGFRSSLRMLKFDDRLADDAVLCEPVS